MISKWVFVVSIRQRKCDALTALWQPLFRRANIFVLLTAACCSIIYRQVCTELLQTGMVLFGKGLTCITNALYPGHTEITVVTPLVTPGHQVPGKGIKLQSYRLY